MKEALIAIDLLANHPAEKVYSNGCFFIRRTKCTFTFSRDEKGCSTKTTSEFSCYGCVLCLHLGKKDPDYKLRKKANAIFIWYTEKRQVCLKSEGWKR